MIKILRTAQNGHNYFMIVYCILFVSITNITFSQEQLASLIIDHTCTNLSLIPKAWIDSVQANWRLHFAHTSHGGQLATGLEKIENANSAYDIAKGISYLPQELGAFCIFDGQEKDSYIDPDEYWKTSDGMNKTRNVINHNPTINASMWSWCSQLDYYKEPDVNAYLDSIAQLESEFSNVAFIYMTSNAQTVGETGSAGYNRYLRNQLIRKYCIENNKVLFDFEDLDSWWFNPSTGEWEHAIYSYSGTEVPVEHPHFNGSESGHTTYESCEQKGKAVWWMMSKLAGWERITPVELSYFKAKITNDKIQLIWQTISEKSNYGFEIERSFDKKQFQKIAFVQGHGTINIQQFYEYIDQTAQPGKYYYYRLKQIDIGGSFEYSPVIEINVAVPTQFNLEQNYPNPFNPSTEICYNLPYSARVQLTIFNVLGSEIKTLVQERQTAGQKIVMWDGKDKNGTDVSSGLYVYRLDIDGSAMAKKKMLLVR